MLRFTSAAAFSVGAVSTIYARKATYCAPTTDYAFDPRGMPTTLIPNYPNAPKDPLILSSVGMRRKNFYIVEVDVYLVGVSLSKHLVEKAKKCAGDDHTAAVACMMNPTPGSKICPRAVNVSAVLRLVRAVSTSQIVDAFNESFSDLSQASVEEFKQALRECLGEAGIKSGEEIIFYWLESGALVVTMNGVVGGVVNSPEVSRRLLDIYIDPKRSVAPEVAKCFHENVLKL